MTDWLWKGLSIVLAGLLAGGVAYHVFEVGALKLDNASKAKAISTLTAEKATVTAENVVLRGANADFVKTTQEQNAALETLKRERDAAYARWKAEVAAGKARSAAYEAKLAALDAVKPKPGEPWYATWQRMMDTYFGKAP